MSNNYRPAPARGMAVLLSLLNDLRKLPSPPRSGGEGVGGEEVNPALIVIV